MRDNRIPIKANDELTLGNTRYRIQGDCIYGGNSLVYFAVDTNDGIGSRTRAIKEFYPREGAVRKNGVVMPTGPASAQRFAEAKERFEYEKSVLNAVSEDNPQVPYYFESVGDESGYGVTAKIPSAVMTVEEWAEGTNERDADKWIIKCLELGGSILNGLGRIHEKGYLHLDLSTGNILCFQDYSHPVAFFIDFGSSIPLNSTTHKAVIDPKQSLSYPTRGVAAPERYIMGGDGHVVLSPATDLFSVGAILLQLILRKNRLDFTKICMNPTRISMLLRELNVPGGVFRQLSDFFKKSLQKDAEKRFLSAEEMLQQVEICLDVVKKKGFHPNNVVQYSRTLFDNIFDPNNFQDSLLSPTYYSFSYERRTMLVGPGGSGKTTLMVKLWGDVLRKYERGQDVPIWISLSAFDGSNEGANGFVRNAIARYFYEAGSDDSTYILEAENLIKNNKVLILLDGINEARDISPLIDELHKDCFANCTLIISSRSAIDPFADECQIVAVKPLESCVVRKALSAKEIEYDNLSIRMKKTLNNPMFLALFLKLVKDNRLFRGSNISSVNTPGEILFAHYTRLINSLAIAHTGKKDLAAFVVLHLLPKIAFEWGRMYFSFKEATKQITQCAAVLSEYDFLYDTLAKKIAKDDDAREKVFDDLLVPMGILICDEHGYVFSHENHLDMFRAIHIKNEMDQAPDGIIPRCLFETGVSFNVGLSAAVVDFISDILGEYKFEEKVSVLSPPSPIESWLHKHAESKSDNNSKIAIMRLIEVMKASRNNRVTADYSELDLTF